MYARAKVVLTSLLVLLLSGSIALAQEYAPAARGPAFTQQELDQMLAPIALYPDALLSQILMAATYPIEIVEAARWSRRNPGLDGDRAVRAVERSDWDPSVKSLVAFPQVLALMDERLEWTERLGDAFLAQPADVMDTIQYLRQKAYTAGNLGSTDQFQVNRQGQVIVIELANPELIYVPYYNPTVVYGTWWWPTYQPVYWASWPGYHVRPGLVRGFAWGPGIRVSANFFFGAADWHRRSVQIVNVNNYYYKPVPVHPQAEIARSTSNAWQHNPARRRDVPYRHATVRQPSDHTSAAPEARRDFRGQNTSAFEGRGGPGNRADARGERGSPPVARVSPVVADPGVRPNREHAPMTSSNASAPQPAGNPPVARVSPVVANPGARANLERAPGGSNVPAVASQPEMRSATSRPNAPAAVSRPNVEQRPAAVDGVGHDANARKSSARGPASHQAKAPVDNAVPASQPSGNVAAPIPSSSASAPRPAGNPRGNGGIPRHQ